MRVQLWHNGVAMIAQLILDKNSLIGICDQSWDSGDKRLPDEDFKADMAFKLLKEGKGLVLRFIRDENSIPVDVALFLSGVAVASRNDCVLAVSAQDNLLVIKRSVLFRRKAGDMVTRVDVIFNRRLLEFVRAELSAC